MTRYALLVRGINVGGKNRVVMAQLRQELAELGLENVETYINSGNIFFDSSKARTQLVEKIGRASCRERGKISVGAGVCKKSR